MHIHWILFAPALAGWCSSLCCAQASLTLNEAIQEGLRSRSSLKAEAERISAAEGVLKQASLYPNPEFQFQNENLRPGQTYSRDVDTLAMFNTPVDVLGKRKQRVAVASEGVTRSRAEFERARVQLVQQVKLAYWEARGAQEIRDLLKTTVEQFQQTIDYHSAQFSVGAIAEQDLLRVKLEGERIRILADLASIDAARARGKLFKQVGRTEFAEVNLTEHLMPELPVMPLGVDQALAQRPEIKVIRAALEEAMADAKLQEIAVRPDLNATVGYKRTELPDALTGVNTAIVSLRVTLPSTDRNQGNRIAAQAEIRRQQQLLAAAETDIRTDYADALQDFELRRSEYQNSFIPLREHAAEIARIAAAAYAEGGTDLLRLLDAQRIRLDADLAWARGMVQYRESIAALEAAEGLVQ